MRLNRFDQELWDACPLNWRLIARGMIACFRRDYDSAFLVESAGEIDGFQALFFEEVPWAGYSLDGLVGQVIYRGTDDQAARDAAAYNYIKLRREWLWAEYSRSANPPTIALKDQRQEMC